MDDTWDPLLLVHAHALAQDVYHVFYYTHGFQPHQINDFGEVIFDHQAHVDQAGPGCALVIKWTSHQGAFAMSGK
jgi:hypothetical protein